MIPQEKLNAMRFKASQNRQGADQQQFTSFHRKVPALNEASFFSCIR